MRSSRTVAKSIAGISVLAVVGLVLAEETYTFTVDRSAKGPDGYPLYITDAEIVAKIPRFSGLGTRIDTCMQGLTIPEWLHVNFPPTISGPHTALSNALNCEKPHDSGEFSCHASLADAQVIFDQDSTQYFTLGPATNMDDALEIFRAYRDGQIEFTTETQPWIQRLKIREISADGKYFRIRKGDCGCSEELKVERRETGGKTSIVAVEKVSAVCI